jgi:hypothetical protein
VGTDPKNEMPEAGRARAADLEPTEAEVAAWVAREQKRREEWLRGPTPEERAAFIEEERERRRAELAGETRGDRAQRMRLRRRGREAQLAAEGAMSLMWRWSRRSLSDLVRAGREWEEESTQPPQRRRVPLDDEDA